MDLTRAFRMTLVTAMLMAVGAVVGIFLGGLSLPLIGLLRGGVEEMQGMFFFVGVGAFVGALVGAFLAPTLGWLLLRNVPLGRAIGYSALGTLAGVMVAAIGSALDILGPFWPLILGFFGFLAAALLLHDRFIPVGSPHERTPLSAPESDISTPPDATS